MKSKSKRYQKPAVWLGCGCGCVVLCPFAMTLLTLVFWWYKDIPRTGEHLSSALEFSSEATNYSYRTRLLHQVREFDIPEAAFLKMCDEKFAGPGGNWKPIEIERLPDEPIHKQFGEETYPLVNDDRKIPQTIMRYVWEMADHEKCGSFDCRCEIDPTGKTDESCFHSVSKGLYYEVLDRDGGGLKMLYDRENGRCYMRYSPW